MRSPTPREKTVREMVFTFMLIVSLGGASLLGIIAISMQQWIMLGAGAFVGIFSVLPIVYLKDLSEGTYDMDEEAEYEQKCGNG